MPSGTTHGRRDGCERVNQPRMPITIIGSDVTPPDGTRSTADTSGEAGSRRRVGENAPSGTNAVERRAR